MLKWHGRYLDIAREVKVWSKDPSSTVGAVIVGRHGQILSTGFNGFPRKMDDREEWLTNREEKYKRIIHAEMNAIYNAALTGVSVEGASIYISGIPPCSKCALGIIQTGIEKVVFSKSDYENVNDRWKQDCEDSINMLNECGICVEII